MKITRQKPDSESDKWLNWHIFSENKDIQQAQKYWRNYGFRQKYP
jgi:hypothetical protein